MSGRRRRRSARPTSTDRAERHGAGVEAPGDGRGGLDLVERHRLARDELEQAAQRRGAVGAVDDLDELPVGGAVAGAHHLLQRDHGLGAPAVAALVLPEEHVAALVEPADLARHALEGAAVARESRANQSRAPRANLVGGR
jgi:hypothetical protein